MKPLSAAQREALAKGRAAIAAGVSKESGGRVSKESGAADDGERRRRKVETVRVTKPVAKGAGRRTKESGARRAKASESAVTKEARPAAKESVADRAIGWLTRGE